MTLDDVRAIEDLDAYKKALDLHDWTFMMSDDHRYYSSGIASERVLMDLAEKNGGDWKYAYNRRHAKAWNSHDNNYVFPYPEVEPF